MAVVFVCAYIHVFTHKPAYMHTYMLPTAREAETNSGRHSILSTKGRTDTGVRKDEDWELTTDATDREATIALTGTVRWNGMGKTQLV